MDLLDLLRDKAGKIPWGAVASVITEEFQAKQGAAGDLLGQLSEWASLLTGNALIKWAPSVASPVPCESPDVSTGRPKPCSRKALATCDICGRRCCLAHARVDYFADAICEVCIGEAKRRARAEGRGPGKPTEAEDVAGALKALKLKKNASWAEVQIRYKDLVKKHNADRPQSDRQRAHNTERLKVINAAYAVLRKHFEEKKAAA